MILPTALVTFVALSCTYAAIGPSASIEIVNKDISPDGYSRSAVLADGEFPGPLIRGNKGDRFLLNVIDKLTDPSMLMSTSVHWHGIFQNGTNFYDGPSFVTQCPITPGNSFLHDFVVPNQAGTFWYHSHLSTQYCDGLRGPLVVYDPADPAKNMYDVDDESTIITLADWYHFPATQAPTFPGYDSTLINGLGRYDGGPLSELAVLSVVKGKRYRFRLISMTCDPDFVLSIDGHYLTVIEVDGVNHHPVTVDSIPISPGQRYSFVLNANQKVDNYWVRAPPNGNQDYTNGKYSAILRYLVAPNVDPTTNSTPTQLLLETDLHPLALTPVPGKPFPGGADVVLNMNISYDATAARFAINNASFFPPTAPVLLQILSGSHVAQDLLPKGSVYELPPNKVVEVSFNGGTFDGEHPFHLHGHNFHVIRSAGNSTYNFADPVIRDTVNTGDLTTDKTTFRFVTDNAGPWFLHCHIDWHLEIGLAIVFAENIPAIAKENPPPAWDQLCPIYNRSAKN
ncbi:yellow laccase [Mycena sp. CBHHK59/15]|nr:yellow laccase [Mycena sp. CBHHK59/15]